MANEAAVGASAVADAVKKVADAAVAEVAKVKSVEIPEILVEGSAGARFVIRPSRAGIKLGTNGKVTFNGVTAKTDGWGATRIEGVLPDGVSAGEVVVHIDDKTQRRGFFRG